MIPTSETFWYWPGTFPTAQADRPCDVCEQVKADQHDDQTPATPEQVAALQARLRDLYDQIGASRRRHREWFLTRLRQSLAETSEPSERERLEQLIAEVAAQSTQTQDSPYPNSEHERPDPTMT